MVQHVNARHALTLAVVGVMLGGCMATSSDPSSVAPAGVPSTTGPAAAPSSTGPARVAPSTPLASPREGSTWRPLSLQPPAGPVDLEAARQRATGLIDDIATRLGSGPATAHRTVVVTMDGVCTQQVSARMPTTVERASGKAVAAFDGALTAVGLPAAGESFMLNGSATLASGTSSLRVLWRSSSIEVEQPVAKDQCR